MKKYLILLIMLVLASLSFAQNQTLTKEQAIEIANTLTVQQDVNVYISKQTISQKREIVTMYKPIFAPENESYLVFIDEQPCESWWHDCKYVFIDVNSSKYEEICSLLFSERNFIFLFLFPKIAFIN